MSLTSRIGVQSILGSKVPQYGQQGKKNEERKLVEQETKFGSKAEQELHAYAWKSMHMRATSSQIHA
ncbi:hypothetical protein PIB30_087927 [Stylosanthes scabra]|uniref:Uncharacterized protein n=1 Tax=Stylosanthes scabra TaxID=79078 RepID=A0ABU6VS02_9FABA|nr:hypothetical protein [Stylosanthes scabra]